MTDPALLTHIAGYRITIATEWSNGAETVSCTSYRDVPDLPEVVRTAFDEALEAKCAGDDAGWAAAMNRAIALARGNGT